MNAFFKIYKVTKLLTVGLVIIFVTALWAMSLFGFSVGMMSNLPTAAQWSLLMSLLLPPLLIAAILLKRWWVRQRNRGGDSGSARGGFGPFPLVPRPPTRRPPVLRAKQSLPL
ncbi:MAG TPA: hypothetical protein VF773_00410 [Verrucomicrobiae bacterium]